jgi:Domain of unknown function (DUF4397)
VDAFQTKNCFNLVPVPCPFGRGWVCQPGQAKYRVLAEFVNGPAVNVALDGKTVGSNVPYQGFVGPSSTGAGSHTLLITDGSGNTDANLTFTLTTGTQSSFFYAGPGVFGGFIVQATDDTTPAANSQKLRVIMATGLSPNLIRT